MKPGSDCATHGHRHTMRGGFKEEGTMRLMLHVRYPGHLMKQAIQTFTSPQMPKRPEYFKELGSMAYMDGSGANTLFIFDVPDDKVGECMRIQGQRNTFFMARVAGAGMETQLGPSISDAIKESAPLLP
jgi:hypothetical protein